MPGKDNGIPDVMSRWAYPACETAGDISIHGDPEQDHDMEEIIRNEKALEKECRVVRLIWPEGMLDGFKNSGKEVAVLTETRKPRILDLFCGTKSRSKPFGDMGWEVHTLDHNPRFHPTICCDILEWNPQEFPPGFFDVVVASPPCQKFSIANSKRPKGLHEGDCMVLQTLRIIEYLQPSVWLLENPRTGDLTHRSYMQHIPHADFDYCEFSDWGYKKPTRIWGSPQISQVKSVLCDGACQNMAKMVEGQKPRHKQWLGAHGHQPSTIQKYRIPEKLVRYLIENLGQQTLCGSSCVKHPPPYVEGISHVSVVTRGQKATGDDAPDAMPSQVPVDSHTPIHPSRSTLGRRKEAQKMHSQKSKWSQK